MTLKETLREESALILTPLIKQIFHGENSTSEKIHEELDRALDGFVEMFNQAYDRIREEGCGEWVGQEAYDCNKDGARLKEGTCDCKCHLFARGYSAAIDDVQEAMRLSEKTRTTVTPGGMVMDSYNDPAEWVPLLKELRKKTLAAIQSLITKK